MNAFSSASASLSVFATTVSIDANSASTASMRTSFGAVEKYDARRFLMERAFPT